MQALDRAQDRDRGRDHPIGVEERGAEETEHEEKFAAPYDFAHERGERENAAFPAIIRAQNQDQIFDRNDENERPKDEGKHPEDVGLGGRNGVLAVKAFAQGIERARADVAIDDPEAGETEQKEAAPASRRFSERRRRRRGGVGKMQEPESEA